MAFPTVFVGSGVGGVRWDVAGAMLGRCCGAVGGLKGPSQGRRRRAVSGNDVGVLVEGVLVGGVLVGGVLVEGCWWDGSWWEWRWREGC